MNQIIKAVVSKYVHSKLHVITLMQSTSDALAGLYFAPVFPFVVDKQKNLLVR